MRQEVGWNLESPGWIALCTDANSFKDSAGSQLLHNPPGVVSHGKKLTQSILKEAYHYFEKVQVFLSGFTVDAAKNIITWILTQMGAFHRWA